MARCIKVKGVINIVFLDRALFGRCNETFNQEGVEIDGFRFQIYREQQVKTWQIACAGEGVKWKCSMILILYWCKLMVC